MMGWTGDNTPIFERFFAGGFQSFRGFAFRGVSPVSDQNPNVYIGGQFMAVGTVEYSGSPAGQRHGLAGHASAILERSKTA